MVSCPELGGIETMIQNASVSTPSPLAHPSLPWMTACAQNIGGMSWQMLLLSPAVLHGLADWVVERTSLSVVLSQLISEGFHTQCSLQLVLADGFAQKTLPVCVRVERGF